MSIIIDETVELVKCSNGHIGYWIKTFNPQTKEQDKYYTQREGLYIPIRLLNYVYKKSDELAS